MSHAAMLARAILICTLTLMIVAGISCWYVLDEPRPARWARYESATPGLGSRVTGNGGKAEKQRGAAQPIEFAAPSELIAALPSTSPSLDQPLPEVQRMPDDGVTAETPGGAETPGPDTTAAVREAEPAAEDSPGIFDPPSAAKPLNQSRGISAPNLPGVLTSSDNPAALAAQQTLSAGDDPLIRLMTALNDPRQAVAAERELAARGFAPNHIELARRFTSADKHVRRDAVRSAISVRGIIAGDWLFWASRDPDPEVRLTAVTLMITSGQRGLLARLEQLAVEDSDPAVRDTARRGLDQLRKQ